MTDTPNNIKELQLKIWLSKSPMERLKQFMEDNASLFQFWAAARGTGTSLQSKSELKDSKSQDRSNSSN
jgi:hypothetical protein